MTSERLQFSFLPLNKPEGPTSHDMVDLLRKQVPRKTKVGHTGTLDPFASGVMIMAVGKATKFSDEIHKLTKRYHADIQLGTRTDTLDPTGKVDLELPVPTFDDEILAKLCEQFSGTLQQVPPIFSAKRVGGKKSYELARQQKSVTLEPSEVTVFDIQLEKKDNNTLFLDVLCSTGTYVRALARDIAEALGTCGHVKSLIRTSVGPVVLEDCVDPADLSRESILDHALPVSDILAKFPGVDLPYNALSYLSQGRPFPTREQLPATFLGTIHGHDGEINAIFRCEYDDMLRAVNSKLLCYRRTTPSVPAS